MKTSLQLTAIVLACAVALPGCGYTLAGRGSFLPDYIRRIGVPLFVNNTPVYEIERRLTQRRGALRHLVDLAVAIQQRVLAVGVEVDGGGRTHESVDYANCM